MIGLGKQEMGSIAFGIGKLPVEKEFRDGTVGIRRNHAWIK